MATGPVRKRLRRATVYNAAPEATMQSRLVRKPWQKGSPINEEISSRSLTIVVPTRDRINLLELCLRSVFEHQEGVPNVIVSDNSTTDLPQMAILRSKYPFAYVRQSGKLRMVDHHNACMRLPTTPWALLLHDDDELAPNIIGRLEAFLQGCKESGLIVGGTQHIDEHGVAQSVWLPDTGGTFRGEDGVRRIGLDFRAAPPSCVWNLAAFQQARGFPDANGAGADFTLVLQVAYEYGVTFLSEVIGRYRVGPQQATDYSTPERAEAILDISIKMAQMTRATGISPALADELLDYMTWWIFRIIAANLFDAHPFFVARMWRKCMRATPPDGRWKRQIRTEYPLLFWRPQLLAILGYKSRGVVPGFFRRRLWDYVRSSQL